MVRDTGETWFDEEDVVNHLKEAGYTHNKDYEIIPVPNIVNITYGRDVGYKIEQEKLDAKTESISASKIRQCYRQ
tara:strand:- start:709 stop:933 length:225 start_codon:yes stop_codon:yes gene_type:complete